MNKKILFLILLTIVAMPVIASAQAAAGGTTLDSMAKALQSAAVAIATPIVVIGWVIAGILYLTSAGSPEKTGTAKKALIACVIGTVLVVLAIGSNMIIDVVKNAFGIKS